MSDDLILMKALTRKIENTDQRHKVIAENIANADMPGYIARDVKPADFSDLLKVSASKLPMQASGMAVTNGAHISSSGSSASGMKGKETNNKDPYERSPNGNTSILEEQSMLLGQNMAEREMALAEYQKQIQMLKAATK